MSWMSLRLRYLRLLKCLFSRVFLLQQLKYSIYNEINYFAPNILLSFYDLYYALMMFMLFLIAS